MVPVRVKNLSLSNVGFVVILQPDDDERSLPVFIGAAEAQAIAFHLENVGVPRPMTHDLLKSVLDALECRLRRVEIWKLEDRTFYGRLVLECEGAETVIDSRPSDSIALALRCAAPILVAEEVMKQAGVVLPKETAQKAEAKPAAKGKSAPKPADRRRTLDSDLRKAIEEERYEDAARLRDEIKQIDTPEHN